VISYGMRLAVAVWQPCELLYTCYSAPDRGAEYCDERTCLRVHVCVFLCPRSYHRNYTSDLHQFFVHVTCGDDSVLFRQRSDTLCASGFMDDVIFAQKPKANVARHSRSAEAHSHAALGLAINLRSITSCRPADALDYFSVA